MIDSEHLRYILMVLRDQSLEIAAEGHAGWGNTMSTAADAIIALSSDIAELRCDYVERVEHSERLESENTELRAEIDRLTQALNQCMVEIDIYIDHIYPPRAHRSYKEANPARVALRSGV